LIKTLVTQEIIWIGQAVSFAIRPRQPVLVGFFSSGLMGYESTVRVLRKEGVVRQQAEAAR
jgi:hypothetical protein